MKHGYEDRITLTRIRMMKESTNDFQAAFELNSGIAQTFVQRVLVLSFKKQYQRIIREFQERLAKGDPKLDDSSLYMLIAKARNKCGDYSGALKDLEYAYKLSPHDSNILLQLGISLERKDRRREAIDAFSQCIKLSPTFSKAYFHRGSLRLKENIAKGHQDLDKALQYDPNFFEAYLARAAFNHSRSEYMEGIDDCNKALKIEATSIRAHLLRGACKCKLGDYTSAIQDFTNATNLDRNSFYAFYNRALTYQLLGDYENAIKEYSIVLLIHHDHNSYRNRGLLYWKLGDHANALIDLSSARDSFPEDANLHALLALCLQKMKLPMESIESFTSAVKAAPLVADSYLGRGNVYASLGNITQARRDYCRALHLNPRCSEASVNIAYLMQFEKRYKKAWEIFNAVITVNPRYDDA